MKVPQLILLLGCGLGLLADGALFAQQIRTARDFTRGSVGFPDWKNDPAFEKDVFTFVRIQYSSGGRRFRSRRGGWTTDCPDAELNLAYRLQQMTSMKVNPDGRILEITDPDLFRYPFIYIVEPGDLAFEDEEVPILRRYLLNGGFLMVDDFWGEQDWENLADQLKRVFPDREIVDLPRTHPLFHGVFDIPNDLNLQCPNIQTGHDSQYTGITWERPDAQECHIRGINDDADLTAVEQYERSHKNRAGVLTAVQHRTEALAHDTARG